MVTSSSRNKKGQHASEKEDISQTQHSAAATPRQPEGAASSGRKRRSTVGGGPMEQEVRRSGRPRKLRKSEGGMILSQMGFSDEAIELAMKVTPRVEEAAQWILEHAASSSTSQAGGTQLQEKVEEDGLFEDVSLLSAVEKAPPPPAKTKGKRGGRAAAPAAAITTTTAEIPKARKRGRSPTKEHQLQQAQPLEQIEPAVPPPQPQERQGRHGKHPSRQRSSRRNASLRSAGNGAVMDDNLSVASSGKEQEQDTTQIDQSPEEGSDPLSRAVKEAPGATQLEEASPNQQPVEAAAPPPDTIDEGHSTTQLIEEESPDLLAGINNYEKIVQEPCSGGDNEPSDSPAASPLAEQPACTALPSDVSMMPTVSSSEDAQLPPLLPQPPPTPTEPLKEGEEADGIVHGAIMTESSSHLPPATPHKEVNTEGQLLPPPLPQQQPHATSIDAKISSSHVPNTPANPPSGCSNDSTRKQEADFDYFLMCSQASQSSEGPTRDVVRTCIQQPPPSPSLGVEAEEPSQQQASECLENTAMKAFKGDGNTERTPSLTENMEGRGSNGDACDDLPTSFKPVTSPGGDKENVAVVARVDIGPASDPAASSLLPPPLTVNQYLKGNKRRSTPGFSSLAYRRPFGMPTPQITMAPPLNQEKRRTSTSRPTLTTNASRDLKTMGPTNQAPSKRTSRERSSLSGQTTSGPSHDVALHIDDATRPAPCPVPPVVTTMFQTNRGQRVTVSEASIATVDHLFDHDQGGPSTMESQENQPIYLPSCDGQSKSASGSISTMFQTGRGQRVYVSEASMAKVGNLFEDNDGNHETSPASGKTAYALPSIGDPVNDSSLVPGSVPTMFETGRGKRVSVSEASMARVGHLFEVSGDGGAAASVHERPSVHQEQTPRQMAAPGVPNCDSAPGSISTMFQTGRGKRGSVSEASIAKVGHLFDHGSDGTVLPMAAGNNQSSIPPLPPGSVSTLFQTGRGQNVSVSEASMAKVGHLFEHKEGNESMAPMDDRSYQAPMSSNPAPPQVAGYVTTMFQTGRGKAVSVSEASMAKVGHIFEQEDSGQTIDMPGKTHHPRAASTGQPSGPTASLESISTMFQTGRGKTVHVSEASMAKVGHLFEATSGDGVPPIPSEEGEGYQHQHPVTSTKSFESAPGSVSTMFQTGRGKRVTVSEASMAKVGHLFETNNDQADTIPTEQVSVNQDSTSSGTATGYVQDKASSGSIATMFRTGRGKTVSISEASMAKVGHLFEHEDSLDTANVPGKTPCAIAPAIDQTRGPPAHPGSVSTMFQTGRGKTVTVSEASLAQVGHLFDHNEGNESMTPVDGSFYHPPITPSSGPLQAAGSSQPVPGSMSTMFQTGRGKAVTVSEASMAKVEHLFEASNSDRPTMPLQEDTPYYHQEPMPVSNVYIQTEGSESAPVSVSTMFQTGRGKRVTVSEASMAKVDHLFESNASKEDGAVSQPSIPQHAPGTATTLNGSLLQPTLPSASMTFQTGRGDTLTVSETSMAKVAHLFQDSVEGPVMGSAAPSTSTHQVARGASPSRPDGNPLSAPSESVNGAEESMVDILQGFESPDGGHDNAQDDDFAMDSGGEGLDAEAMVEDPSAVTPAQALAMPAEDNAGAFLLTAADTSPSSMVISPSRPSMSAIESHEDANQSSCQQQTPSSEEGPLGGGSSSTAELVVPSPEVDWASLMTGTKEGSRLRLRDLGSIRRVMARGYRLNCGVRPVTLEVTSDNAHRLRFDDKTGAPRALDEEAPHTSLPEELEQALLRDMGMASHPKPPSGRWLANHYRLVVWKLACMDRTFPEKLGGRYLTWPRVVKQLQYRLMRERDRGERSALKMVLNTDAPSTQLMILCVSHITFPPLLRPPPSENEGQQDMGPPPVRLELTDGWYCIDSMLDAALSRLARQGRITAGTKLAICNAVLQGVSGGVDPLEVNPSEDSSPPFLCLSINSTRKAKWDSKLGFQRRGPRMQVPISSLTSDGGPVAALEVVVLRRYPMLYLEKTTGEAGQEVRRTLTEAEEAEAEAEHEALCHRMMEKMVEVVDKEAKQAGGGAKKRPLVRKKNTGDGDGWKDEQAQWSKRMEEVRKRVEADPRFHRQSQPFFRVKVCWIKTTPQGDLHPSLAYQTMAEVSDNTAILTVWDVKENFLEALQEGNHVLLTSLTTPKPRPQQNAPAATTSSSTASTTAGPQGPFRLYASKSTRVEVLHSPSSPSLLHHLAFTPRQEPSTLREDYQRCQAACGPNAKEMDVVGYLLGSMSWEEEGRPGKLVRLFFTDASRCILCVERRHYENSGSGGTKPPSHGDVYAFTDLVLDSYDSKTDTIMARHTGNSTMRKQVRSPHLRGAVEKLDRWVKTREGGVVLEEEKRRLTSLLSEDVAEALRIRYDYRLPAKGYILLPSINEIHKEGLHPGHVWFVLDADQGLMRVWCMTEGSIRALTRAIMMGSDQDHHQEDEAKDNGEQVQEVIEELMKGEAQVVGVALQRLARLGDAGAVFDLVLQWRRLASGEEDEDEEVLELIDARRMGAIERCLEIIPAIPLDLMMKATTTPSTGDGTSSSSGGKASFDYGV